jgi:hypothetical protein
VADKILSKNELVSLSVIAQMVDELKQTGAITEEESKAIINTTWNDSARNRATNQARYHAMPIISPLKLISDENANMNPKLIMNTIDKNREVMEAQIERFSSLSHKHSLIPNADGLVTVASILQNVMFGHLQSAAASLDALAETEADVRKKYETMNRHSADHEGVVIEGEAIVIDPVGEDNENN